MAPNGTHVAAIDLLRSRSLKTKGREASQRKTYLWGLALPGITMKKIT